MISLRKLSAEIIRLESSGSQSDDSELSEAYVILMCRQALNKLLVAERYKNLNLDDRGPMPMAIASYEVSVQGTNPNKYIDLPEFYQNLPFNEGLKGVAPVKDRTNEFIQRQNPAVSRNLPCADLEPDQYSYFTEGSKIYFDNDLPLGKVLLKLVVIAPDSIGINDSLPLFPEMQADAILMVRQMLAGQPLQDKKLDGNKDISVRIP